MNEGQSPDRRCGMTKARRLPATAVTVTVALWAGAMVGVARGQETDAPAAREAPAITDWQVSRAYPADRLNRQEYPNFFAIFQARWRTVQAEPTGLVDLATHVERAGITPVCALARTICRAGRRRTVNLRVTHGGDLDLFLNGHKLFSERGASGEGDNDRRVTFRIEVCLTQPSVGADPESFWLAFSYPTQCRSQRVDATSGKRVFGGEHVQWHVARPTANVKRSSFQTPRRSGPRGRSGT